MPLPRSGSGLNLPRFHFLPHSCPVFERTDCQAIDPGKPKRVILNFDYQTATRMGIAIYVANAIAVMGDNKETRRSRSRRDRIDLAQQPRKHPFALSAVEGLSKAFSSPQIGAFAGLSFPPTIFQLPGRKSPVLYWGTKSGRFDDGVVGVIANVNVILRSSANIDFGHSCCFTSKYS
jgi:hypothetical protein